MIRKKCGITFKNIIRCPYNKTANDCVICYKYVYWLAYLLCSRYNCWDKEEDLRAYGLLGLHKSQLRLRKPDCQDCICFMKTYIYYNMLDGLSTLYGRRTYERTTYVLKESLENEEHFSTLVDSYSYTYTSTHEEHMNLLYDFKKFISTLSEEEHSILSYSFTHITVKEMASELDMLYSDFINKRYKLLSKLRSWLEEYEKKTEPTSNKESTSNKKSASNKSDKDKKSPQ